MKTRHFLSLLCLLWLNSLLAVAQNNTLSIPDVTVPAGKTISLPVNLDNTADIVAVQFTLTVPEGITVQPSSVAMTERADDHTVTMRPVGANKYMAMVFSPANKAIKGRTGKLVSVNLTASSGLEEGSEHQLTLSDVVIGAVNGDNLATGFSAGKVTVAKSPDLEVSAVSTTVSTVNPGDKINVSWQVGNVGGLPTEAGWNEQIYLDGENGSSKLLSTTYYENALNAGGIVSRSAEITVPQILSVDGIATIRVKLTPDSKAGEPSWLRENNDAATQTSVTVNKFLALTPAVVNIEENSKQTMRFYLARSGNTLSDETFTLTATSDSRIPLPESVTIAKGQSGVYFYAQTCANGVLDDNDIVEIALSGNGYEKVDAVINVEDDTYPSLSITSSAQEVEEGKSITFSITAERAPKEDLEIKLSNDLSSRFNIPAITLPAGQTKVDVTVEAKEDDVPDVEQVVTFTASAAGYNSASMNIALIDDDVPTLQLTLTPNAVSEASGPLAVVAKLRRTDNINKVVTVKFSDDSDGDIYYGRQSVEMAAGVEEVTVNLGPIDNAIVDGQRTYNISAAVWIASCSCNANNGSSGGVVTVPLTVYDNDGPALAVKSGASVVKEGEEIQVTVSRNTESSTALAVNISSDHDSALEYPKTVTIPANETSATFTVKSVKNEVNDDSFTAIVTVESEGFAKANVWFMVTDQTLPDAQITGVEVSETEIEAGKEITVTATLTNTGSYELPELTKVGFYHSGSHTALATAYLQAPLAAGESVTISKTISLPDAVGTYNVYAVANDGQEVKELLYTNNTSATVAVKAVSPFTFSVKTDKNIYQQGETVNIKGSIHGNDVANKSVEVYVINDGYRQVINVATDESGSFAAEYKPYSGQMGYFIVGACYQKEGLTESLASFDVYGIKRTNNSYITCEALMGEDFNGSFEITNPGVLPVSGAKVSVTSQPENCDVEFSCPDAIAAGATANVTFKIKPNAVSEGNDWERIVLNVETNEGAKLETTLYYYCYNKTGKLKSSVASIKTTMLKDASRDYPFIITNIGKGETGKISLALPDWMTAVTPAEMASMAYGDSTTVILRFTPTSDMQLNVPVTGQIGINCSNGEGMALPFSIEPVSETTGVLTVDVCDEYTYYTSEAPHVKGAQVKVTHPATGALLASGETDENGKFSVTLNEGYYAVSVTADKHDTYRNNILVDPSKEKSVTVNLSVEAVTVDWKVEETEIEDEYKIVTTVKYETNVPTPVIILDCPKNIGYESMKIGESTILLFTATNKGLITAKDVEVFLPGATANWKFDYLEPMNPFDLAPQQSVTIPVKFTRIGSHTKNSMRRAPGDTYRACMANMEFQYYVICGKELKKNRGAAAFAVGTCMLGEIGNAISGWGAGGIGGGLGTPGGNHSNYNNSNTDLVVTESNEGFCDPCQTQLAWKTVDCLIGFVPIWGCAKGVADCTTGNGANGWRRVFGCATTAVSCTAEICAAATRPTLIGIGCTIVGWLANIGQCLVSFTEPCNSDGQVRANSLLRVMEKQSPSYIEGFQQKAQIPLLEVTAYRNWLNEIIGDSGWENVPSNDMAQMLENMLCNEKEMFDADEWMKIKPENVSSATFMRFLERVNNTIKRDNGEPINSDNYIDYDKLAVYVDHIVNAEKQSMALGFSSTQEMWAFEYKTVMQKLSENSNSVCSSITLQFEQKMVMTRQAFRGTLTVFNGSETTAMTNVKLNLIVTDEDGKVATSHEFQINPESLASFNGKLNFEDGWTLDPQETGVAKVLFIPTKFAAPTVEKRYSFGGTLSYVDPFTGLEVTRTLTPITLTVKPSPSLDLTYFMQRDIIGDDPLTEEIEPCEEAEFSLLINNKGYGDANNVKMTTNQPQIIDNEKGLLIDFELMSSQLNGGEKTLALGNSVATDFGTIPANSTSYAQWWIKSSLLGHFTDYDVEATHVTSYDNPDLSLLNDVTIHELIRSLEVTDGENKMVGFMTNDIVDAEDTPDMLYLSNGEIEPVVVTSDASIVKVSDTDYTMTITPSKEGWNYGNLTDPTYGVVKLQKVVRQSDGKEISLRNFWQTDRTLRDGKDPLYENRIHFADNFMSGTAETYTLTFESMPDLLLEVASIEGIPAEGTIAYDHVEKVNVMFNKHIDPATFTAEDITLTVQGKKQEASLIGITTEDNKTFALDFTELNKTTGNGYYVLAVQTAGITDSEGFNGKTGKSVGWNMYKDGLIQVNASVNPVEAGTIYGSKNAVYGEDISLTATANEGYVLSHWTVNGEEGGREETISHTAVADVDIVANFTKKSYSIEIDNEIEGGSIVGCGTGIYQHGDELWLVATPNTDYKFCYWIVGNEKQSDETEMTVTVTSATKVSAKFKYVGQYHLQQNLAAGWNWISCYLNEPQPVDVLLNNSNRIVGQFDETVNDPELGIVGGIESLELGKAYKIDVASDFSATFTGYLLDLDESPITQKRGWNWIAYPYYENRNIETVITNADEGDCIASQYGFTSYADGYWEGSVNQFNAGHGYLYKSSMEKTLAFDFDAVPQKGMAPDKYADDTTNGVDVHKYPNTMNITARLHRDGFEITDGNYDIYAMSGNELRGVGRFVNGNYYITVYGDKPTDISFIIEGAGETFMAKETLTFTSDIVGSRKSPYIINVGEATGMGVISLDNNDIVIYTVEGLLINKKATLNDIKRLSRGVYIINGRKYLVK